MDCNRLSDLLLRHHGRPSKHCTSQLANHSARQDNPIDILNSNWGIHKEAPFKLKIAPRSQAHIELINRIGTEALAADYLAELKCWKRR
jgi:hypothetical protein